jgi:hypothetical protein
MDHLGYKMNDDKIQAIISIVKEAPTIVLAILVWSELRQIRVEMVPIIHTLNERVQNCPEK